MDKELEAREGHKFVRYADDISIYVKSERAAQRVKESTTDYLEKELKLRVNRGEDQGKPRKRRAACWDFPFYLAKGKWEVRIAPKSLKRIKEKIRARTKRNDPSDAGEKIKKLEALIEGWVEYFRRAQARSVMQRLDEWTRIRIRICLWKQWKQPQTRLRKLRQLGATPERAYRWGNSSWGYCRMAHSWSLTTTITNSYLQSLGYIGFSKSATVKNKTSR